MTRAMLVGTVVAGLGGTGMIIMLQKNYGMHPFPTVRGRVTQIPGPAALHHLGRGQSSPLARGAHATRGASGPCVLLPRHTLPLVSGGAPEFPRAAEPRLLQTQAVGV